MPDPCPLSSPWRRTPPEAVGLLGHTPEFDRRERLPAGGRQIRTPSPTSNGIAVGGRSGQSSASRSDLRGFGFMTASGLTARQNLRRNGTGGSNPVPSSAESTHPRSPSLQSGVTRRAASIPATGTFYWLSKPAKGVTFSPKSPQVASARSPSPSNVSGWQMRSSIE
jgi:hypothetical protein